MKVSAATLAESLRQVIVEVQLGTRAGDHVSPDVVVAALRVLARWDDQQRRLAAFRAGEIARRRAPRSDAS